MLLISLVNCLLLQLCYAQSEGSNQEQQASNYPPGLSSTYTGQESFVLLSQAFAALRDKLNELVRPTFDSSMTYLAAEWIQQEKSKGEEASTKAVLPLLRQIVGVQPSRIYITTTEYVSGIERLQNALENLTNCSRGWWPLHDPMKPVPPGAANVHWQCVSNITEQLN
jgi:hypothetical protein